MVKRKPVDANYVIFSKYYEDVREEMLQTNYLTSAKDVDMAKQAEPMGLTAQEVCRVDHSQPEQAQEAIGALHGGSLRW
jgi:hypothetical protein